MGYLLDTYAMVEIIKGNKNYAVFLDKEIFTNLLNLYELYFILLRDYDEEKAKKYFSYFRRFSLDTLDSHIFGASKFKLENNKLNLSYADCLGYAMALENDLKFLTGDKEFEKFNNVEFVK